MCFKETKPPQITKPREEHLTQATIILVGNPAAIVELAGHVAQRRPRHTEVRLAALVTPAAASTTTTHSEGALLLKRVRRGGLRGSGLRQPLLLCCWRRGLMHLQKELQLLGRDGEVRSGELIGRIPDKSER